MIANQIIVDKSAFVGIVLDLMREFANQHFLILPSVLYDECVTNEGRAGRLLERYEKLILAGGYFCPSIWNIAKAEAVSFRPYGMLPDFNGTKRWRSNLDRGFRESFPIDARSIRNEHLRVAKSTLMRNPMVVDTLCRGEFGKACSEVKRTHAGRQDRLRAWASQVDRLNLDEVCAGVIGLFGSSVDARRMSNEWVIWHHVRIITIMALEYRFLGESRRADKVEHDLQDIEYVSLLTRADALLSKDKGLGELARAAFPEKDVFSGLEEVPASYRCDWAD